MNEKKRELEAAKTSVWNLEQVTEYLQKHHLALHYDDRRGIDLWSPQTKVPIGLRRAVVRFQVELLALMEVCDARVCPSPKLHKRFLRRRGSAGPGRHRCKVCLVCLQLDSSRQMGNDITLIA